MSDTRTLTWTFSGSGTDTFVAPAGTFFRITSSTANVTISAKYQNREIASFSSVGQGDFWQAQDGDAFDQLQINSSSAQTITIVVGVGKYEKSSISGSVNATVTVATTLTSTADVSCTGNAATQVLAANTNRKSAIIKNLATNTQVKRVGDGSVTATRGHELLPGESVVLDATSIIKVYNIGATAESVSVLEVAA